MEPPARSDPEQALENSHAQDHFRRSRRRHHLRRRPRFRHRLRPRPWLWPHHYAPAHRSYHKPTYHRPNYIHTHTYVQPPVTKSYEKREVYFYEKVKVKGYCKDVVKTRGYQQWRQTVHCKKGEAAPAEQPEEPAAE